MNDVPNSKMEKNVHIALFGPQALQWTKESLSDLRDSLLPGQRLHYLQDAVKDLPLLWPALRQELGLPPKAGTKDLSRLSDFLAGGDGLAVESLNNVHLAVLTVLLHASEIASVTGGPEPILLSEWHAAQGFCIGFLSATAFALSDNATSLQHNIAVALRLAGLVGLTVDAENQSVNQDDQPSTVSVRWKTDADRSRLATELDRYDEVRNPRSHSRNLNLLITLWQAYISCITDDRTVTLTFPEHTRDAICSTLTQSSIAWTNVNLAGYFHHARHKKAASKLKRFCSEHSSLRFPNIEQLKLPLRSTVDGEIIVDGLLHEVVIDAVLCRRANWFSTVHKTIAQLPREHISYTFLGQDAYVPRSLTTQKPSSDEPKKDGNILSHDTNDVEEIAVVGMACRFPQADSLDEFWDLIASGRTALGDIPLQRFDPKEASRSPSLAKYKGNFLQNPDVFDHKFFGISGREAKSLDPQQRLALQVAYEALESAGYWSRPGENRNVADVGCYLGVGSVDYEGNVNSDDANAFSATGTLRAFISGRLSHQFGFTGPSVTFDTACSSSAVAIHNACKVSSSRNTADYSLILPHRHFSQANAQWH